MPVGVWLWFFYEPRRGKYFRSKMPTRVKQIDLSKAPSDRLVDSHRESRRYTESALTLWDHGGNRSKSLLQY